MSNAFHTGRGVDNGSIVVVAMAHGVQFDLTVAVVYANANAEAIPHVDGVRSCSFVDRIPRVANRDGRDHTRGFWRSVYVGIAEHFLLLFF